MERLRVSRASTNSPEASDSVQQPIHQRPACHPVLRLQRTLGNRAVQRLLHNRAIQATPRNSHHSDIDEQEGNKAVDETTRIPEKTLFSYQPSAISETKGNKINRRAPAAQAACSNTTVQVRTSPAPLAIHRFLTVGKPIIKTENLAQRIMDGRNTAGFVAIWLNEKRVDGPDVPTREAAAKAAIKRPDVGSRYYNVEGPQGPELHGDGWIENVANNELKIQAQWLTSPPWTVITTKGDVGRELFLGMCSGTAPCTLTVNGKPDESVLAADTQHHELRHANDVAAAFESVFKPWDDKITLAWETGKVFSGPPAKVNAELWKFLGGSPEEIAIKFVAEVERLGNLLHGGLAEPKLDLKNNKAGPNCDTASVDAEGGK